MIALTNGKINTVTNGIIKRGTILIKEGKIADVGPDVNIPKTAKEINLRGKWVTPGLIDAHCHIGIWEESIGWAGNDGNEATEPITPQLRALDGIKANADEGGLKAAAENGITTVQLLPGSANVIGGTGVVIKTAPKTTIDDMIVIENSGMKVAFGENPRRVYGDKKVLPSTRMGVAGIMREWLYKTKNYMEKKERFADKPEKQPDKDLKLEALIPVLKGEIPMRVHAHRADDVATAIRICEEFGIKMSWEHATEGHRIAEYIAEKNIPAVWGPGLNWRSKWETRERTFETVKNLVDAGVKVALQTDADNGKIGFLPIHAALAVRDGLSEEEAWRTITINPAEILGVADRVGSIEKGKDADLRITKGDPFDPRSQVMMVFIDGELVFSR